MRLSSFTNKMPFWFRRLAERVSREVTFDRRLPKRFGSLRMRLSPGASLIYWAGLNRPNFQDIYDFVSHHVKPGDVVWDIGGNIGVFSFSAAAVATTTGRVLCVEPDLWSVRLLKQTCRYNAGLAAPVEVLPVAISDQLSLEWLHIAERSRAASHLAKAEGGSGQEITGGVRERHLTPVFTLDWLADHYPLPDVLKIDVDGSEYRVLTGGVAMLKKKRPVLILEVYERNADAVTALLAELNYDLFNYDNGEALKTPISRTAYNTLALPRPQS